MKQLDLGCWVELEASQLWGCFLWEYAWCRSKI